MKNLNLLCFLTFLGVALFFIFYFSFNVSQNNMIVENHSKFEGELYNNETYNYLLHESITVTVFWIGESAGKDNDFISNKESAWDDNWENHYGGFDNPEERDNYFPLEFTPNENPFYFALPYNDFDFEGKRKENVKEIFWYSESIKEDESLCKNRWIRILKDDKVVYAQWEDSGPFQYDDIDYVFGIDSPKNKKNNNAGLDVSPAVRDYLNLEDIDIVDWQFIDFSYVPEGPWKEIITISQISWE